MRKKEVIFLAIIITLFNSVLISAAADVAYIYDKSFRVDDNIIEIFNQLGLTVELVDEDDFPVDFDQFQIIFVNDERFSKKNQIPVNSKPSIVANYYHADTWGLTDAEGVSQLASTDPLHVIQNGISRQVYTAANGFGQPAIPYYYLGDENKASGLETVALTEVTSSGSDFGDVISYAEPGTPLFNGRVQNAKLCFFGIIESDYWTPFAEQLFDQCVSFVSAACTLDSDCPAPTNSAPFCQNGDVHQNQTAYTCEPGTFAQCVSYDANVLLEDCPFGCANGQCIGECFFDSDCGADGFINAPFCSNNDVVQEFETFTCNNPGQSNASCSSQITEQTLEMCEDICSNGICEAVECFSDSDCNDFNSSTQDICHNAATPESFCTNGQIECFFDSDCGTDGFIESPFCSNNDVVQEFQTWTCSNAGTQDSSCSSSLEEITLEMCADLCSNGACQDITCNEDADCDDSNPLTFDECLNPGTIVSQCRNTPVNCASDSDCGFTGFIGEEFCSLDNINKNFQNATCLNPGETHSSCSVEITSQTLTQCDAACSEGSCIVCDENIDCNDFNSETIDLCHNPGTQASFCTNEETNKEITCSLDSDCGVDSIISPLFCSANRVSQLTQAWTCNNANTTLSFCSSNLEIEVVEQCSDVCQAGGCVEITCFNHADCDDQDELTTDICNEAGTPESFCTNTPIDITCFEDSDCGTDGTLGEPFCLSNDVVQFNQEFKCNEAGTPQSYCASEVEPGLVEECEFTCSDGECIPPQGECTPGETRLCGTNIGECRTGVQLCLSNSTYTSECFGEIKSTTEICDERDNNCDGLIDEGGVCEPSCTDECTEGAQECAEGTPRVCGNIDSDVCTEWIALPPCETGEICQIGHCVESCTDECVSGARECSLDGTPRICGDVDADSCTEWVALPACNSEEICSEGLCIPEPPSCTDECTFGTRQCSGTDGYQFCFDYDGNGCTEWSSKAHCDTGDSCSGGFCS